MPQYKDVFPLQHSELLIISLLLGVISIYFNQIGKNKAAIYGLFISGFILRLFIAYLDPFLNEWDERFHALVAKNMMTHPFIPMMHANPIMPYDYTIWCCNHIWLHKQPLFMWQMALSMKLFGVSEYAIRYPSVLIGSLMVPLVYRITDLFTKNKRIAFIAGLLMCFSYYNLQLTSGYLGMDHNDICFEFYILASIWAFTEYKNNSKLSWAILIGIFAGCAILTKWLVGLLVFSGWGILICISLFKKDTRKEIVHFIIALLSCVIIFLPWQIYIFHTFPAEAQYEYSLITRHLSEAIEGAKGSNWFYWDNLNIYFGKYIWIFILLSIPVLISVKNYRNKYTIALSAIFITPFIFFSLFVTTKVLSFLIVIVPIGYIFIATSIFHIIEPLQKRMRPTNNRYQKMIAYFFSAIILLLAGTNLNLPDITAIHDPKNLGKNNIWQLQAYNNDIYKHLKSNIPPNTKVVFNMFSFDETKVMFYNDIEAYAWVPPENDFNKYIKAKRIPIAIFKQHREYGVPDYIKNYEYCYIIDKELK